MGAVRLIDVAKAAGVSQGTVSNVFNRPELVRETVREKVLACAEALGYRGPDPAGRLLRAGRVGAIGVVTSNPVEYFFEDPFARVFMSGVASAASRAGSGLMLISSRDTASAERVIANALVDSFIVLCAEEGDPLAIAAGRRGLPLVRVDAPASESASGLVVDDREGARLAASHLLGLGHRSLAAVVAPMDRSTDHYCGAAPTRLDGYRDALAAVGLPRESLTVLESGADRNLIRRFMIDSWQGSEPVTAILAMSDRIAFEVLDVASSLGLDVPDDVSVVGFDDVPEAKTSRPPLTTVRQPVEEKGRLAVELLSAQRTRTVTLPVELVVRASSAAPPARR
ncbi:LacI family DNA-binding transcriptional regulator [Pelagibacterium montanilacus]|uniref:LacI family DNA-binding transcriptional regulator n=1 Tax=Pelagibacterium montanilacus TaxID=2185280 RepID=UPI000F8F7DA9|nr:LacI family DNA-binding transcriptional regulator [Pelagibacterium montanilacus]